MPPSVNLIHYRHPYSLTLLLRHDEQNMNYKDFNNILIRCYLFLSTASNIPEQRAGGPRAGGVGRAGRLVSPAARTGAPLL